MKTLLVLLCWCILFALSWPLAIVVLVLAPIVWLLSIPFRILGAVFEGMIALLRSLFMLPARILR
jgi:hypothetical protein